jgi:hypothetical protein
VEDFLIWGMVTALTRQNLGTFTCFEPRDTLCQCIVLRAQLLSFRLLLIQKVLVA